MKKQVLCVILVPFLVLLFCSVAFAETAQEAYKKGVKAYGNENFKLAAIEFSKAAEQGHAMAQFNLGVMYREGEGVAQDYGKAVKWYREAAEQGYASAQCSLGVMYNKGEGVQQNYAESAKWYRKAAEQGDDVAQVFLGMMYHQGEGVTQDYFQAYIWCSLAAADSSGELREIAVKYRNDAAEHLAPAQLAKAQKITSEWKPKK